jgi:hypothetical protein
VFNTEKSERLAKWRQFREGLETSETPLEDVVELWSNAPFVYSYLDPFDSSKWPDPWHLILDMRLDNIAIPLGMLYTLKLTKRFADTKCELYMLDMPKNNWSAYYLLVDDRFVLNLEYGKVIDIEQLNGHNASMIYPDRKFL